MVESAIATDFDFLDEEDAVWDHLETALSAAVDAATPIPVYLAFERAALAALHQGEADLALHFQDEVVAAAVRTGQAYIIAEALRGRASLREAAGDRPRALADLERAERQLSSFRDEQTLRVVEGDIARVRGETERALDPPRALASLDRAITIDRQTHY